MSIQAGNSLIASVLEYTSASMVFVWLTDRSARGFSGLMGVILELPLLVYFGKISYGIYVYHLLVNTAIYKIFTYLSLPYPGSVWIKFVLNTVVTIIVAGLSWQFFEKPINAFKRKFDYYRKEESSISSDAS